jgi:hypothetical protein
LKIFLVVAVAGGYVGEASTSPSFSAAENGGNAAFGCKADRPHIHGQLRGNDGGISEEGSYREVTLVRIGGIEKRKREQESWYRATGCRLAVPSGLAPLAKPLDDVSGAPLLSVLL